MTPLPDEARDLLSSAVLADVLDGLGHRHSALPPNLRPLRPTWKLFGRAATLSTMPIAVEPILPYAVELECIDALQAGDVLVATTNGDRSSALWGELLSTAARAHGAVGVILDGLTRDAARILAMDFPVFACGFSPLDSKGRLDGICHGQPIRIGECVVRPDDWVFGDIDGVVVVPAEIADTAFARALEKVTGENRVREELGRGRSIREVFAEYRIREEVGMSSALWSDARAAMLLDATAINLNTGSFGPLPRVVFERVTALRQRLAEEPMDFLLRGAPPLWWEARERLAHFVGGDPRRLVFTANVSAAINLVASSLPLASPGEILLSDHEYGAMHWCWERAAQRQALTLRTFPLPILPSAPGEIVAAACAAMTARTRLLFFSHVLSPTGMVLPARELCAEARRRGILTMVDGAHAPAFIPLNLDAINADYYGSNCHKWLLAPTGTGFLYAATGALDHVQPPQVSWGWRPDRSRLDERDEFGSTPRLRHFEFEGTRDPCPWLAIPTAIDFQAALGWQRIRTRIAELTRHVRQRLTGLAGLLPSTPDAPEMHGAMIAYRLPDGLDAVTLRRGLWEKHRIEAPIVERPDRLLLRTSTHFYNTEAEVDRLAEALSELLS